MTEQNVSENNPKIGFVDSQGKKLFEIWNGECVELIYEDGSYYIGICSYVDELHFKLDGQLWDLLDFAKKMEQNGITYQDPCLEKAGNA